MPIPGSNLLQTALTIIAKQRFQYYAFCSRTLNDVGQDISNYDPPVPASGNVQPVPRTLYQAYGLDLQCYYVNFYMPQNVIDIARDVAGDQIRFNGQLFECMSKTDWDGIDGWVAVLAVRIPG